MTNYYFLITAFPPLSLEGKSLPRYDEVQDLLRMNLTEGDLKLVRKLLGSIDLYNIRAFLLGAPLDSRGQFSPKELEEELLVKQELPDYIVDYLDRYESSEDRLRYFSSLYAQFYRKEIQENRGFLQKYFCFERELRLVLTALRAKQFGRDLVRELQFEDPFDPLVAMILAQKDMTDFTPPREYEMVKTLFENNHTNPQKLNRVILQYRFDQIEEMGEPQDFGIDCVLAYLARLLIVEKLAEEDLEKGMEQLSQYE